MASASDRRHSERAFSSPTPRRPWAETTEGAASRELKWASDFRYLVRGERPSDSSGDKLVPGVTLKKFVSSVAGVLCAGIMVAGCSNWNYGRGPEPPPIDPNIYPSAYETELITFLRDYLTSPNDFRAVSISAPALKPFESIDRYVVCVRLESLSKEKVAIFNGGRISQFIDATPPYCGGVAYRHFAELEAARPR